MANYYFYFGKLRQLHFSTVGTLSTWRKKQSGHFLTFQAAKLLKKITLLFFNILQKHMQHKWKNI